MGGWSPVLRQAGADLAFLATVAAGFFFVFVVVALVVSPPWGSPPWGDTGELDGFLSFVGVGLGPEAILVWFLRRVGRPGRMDTPIALWVEGAIAAAGAVGTTALGMTLLFAALDVSRFNPWNSGELAAALWAVFAPVAIAMAWSARQRHRWTMWCVATGLALLGGGLVVWAGLRPGMDVGDDAIVVALLCLTTAAVVTLAALATRRPPA